MKESATMAPLTMHWVPVVDASGDTRLAAVWAATPTSPATSIQHVAA